MYLQCVDDVIMGHIPIEDESTAIELAATAMAVDVGEEVTNDPDELIEVGLEDYIPAPWRGKKEIEEWAAEAGKLWNAILVQEVEDLQVRARVNPTTKPANGRFAYSNVQSMANFLFCCCDTGQVCGDCARRKAVWLQPLFGGKG